MALGFRDCCNEFNYFLLRETPASVSEFEIYYIETLEGPSFCATYLNLPPLNYTPTTYNVATLSQRTDCQTCISLNPCPTEENIIQNQFGQGSVITQTDCNFTSIRYLDVECFPVNPTYQNSLDGQVVLFVTGGVPPYTFRNFVTGEVLQANPVIDNFYTVLPNVPAGDYRIVVSDTDENFIIDITCTLTAPPPFPVFTATTVDATVYGKPDGQINLFPFELSAGTPPYIFIINGGVYTIPNIIIGAGTYVVIIQDQYYTTQITVTVGEPPPVDYPDKLCLNVNVTTVAGCSQVFGVNFERFVSNYDYRAQYFATNPESVGFSNLNLRYEVGALGWIILPEFWGANPQFSTPCPVAIIASGDIGFRKFDGTTDTPDGNWESTNPISFADVTVSAGACAPSLGLRSTTDVCNQATPILGSVTLEARGGTGPPYRYTVIDSRNTAIISNNPVINNLYSDKYKSYVEDKSRNKSNTVNFEINSTTPYVLNLANINQCLTYTQNSVFLNVVPAGAGGGVNRIDPGESRRTRITTTTNFNFSFLPIGFEVTTRITIVVDFTVNVSVTPYTDPRTYFINNINSSPITTSTITTDGVTSDFMNGVNYVTSTYPNPLLGDGWYRIANGSVSCATGTGNCPAPLDVNGARYRKTVTWTSNLLTINNTTSISLSYFNEFINSIPIIIGTTTGCYNGCGGGQVFATLDVKMLTPTKRKGCGSIAGTNRRLMYYIFSQHPNNGARFNGDIPPIPLCP